MRKCSQDYRVSAKYIEPIFYIIPTVKKKILNVPFSVRLNQKFSASTVIRVKSKFGLGSRVESYAIVYGKEKWVYNIFVLYMALSRLNFCVHRDST